jgi:hypothetical protein
MHFQFCVFNIGCSYEINLFCEILQKMLTKTYNVLIKKSNKNLWNAREKKPLIQPYENTFFMHHKYKNYLWYVEFTNAKVPLEPIWWFKRRYCVQFIQSTWLWNPNGYHALIHHLNTIMIEYNSIDKVHASFVNGRFLNAPILPKAHICFKEWFTWSPLLYLGWLK